MKSWKRELIFEDNPRYEIGQILFSSSVHGDPPVAIGIVLEVRRDGYVVLINNQQYTITYPILE